MNQIAERTSLSRNIGPHLAIVGCGAIAEDYYLPAMKRYPSLLADTILVDSNKSQLEKLAQSYRVKRSCTDYHQILDEVDGVILALPTALHEPIGLDFLSAGVPVLCEKPLAENADKAKRMIETAKQRNVPLAVNYLGRVTPHFAQTKKYLEQKTFGKLLSLKYLVGEAFNWPTVSGFYFLSDKSSRGILRDRGAHAVDHICWWLGGKPTLISSKNDAFGGSEAVADVEFEYEGRTGRLRLNWFVDIPSRFTLECEHATIEGDIYDYHHLVIVRDGRASEIQLKTSIQTKTDIADRIIANFVNVILHGTRPLISGADVLDSLEFVDECYRAASRFRMPWYDLAEVPNVA